MSPAVSQMSPQYVRLSGEVADQAIVLGTRQSAFPCEGLEEDEDDPHGSPWVLSSLRIGSARALPNCNEPFQQPLDANAIGLVADSASPSI